MSITELTPVYNNQVSFYGKAHVFEVNGSIVLQSYETEVARITGDKLEIFGTYSATTMRHIRDFIFQYYSRYFDLSIKNIRKVIESNEA